MLIIHHLTPTVNQRVRGGYILQRYQRSIRKDTALYPQISSVWGYFAKRWGVNAKGAVKSQRWGIIAKTLPPKRKGFLNSGVKTQKTVVIDRLFSCLDSFVPTKLLFAEELFARFSVS